MSEEMSMLWALIRLSDEISVTSANLASGVHTQRQDVGRHIRARTPIRRRLSSPAEPMAIAGLERSNLKQGEQRQYAGVLKEQAEKRVKGEKWRLREPSLKLCAEEALQIAKMLHARDQPGAIPWDLVTNSYTKDELLADLYIRCAFEAITGKKVELPSPKSPPWTFVGRVPRQSRSPAPSSPSNLSNASSDALLGRA